MPSFHSDEPNNITLDDDPFFQSHGENRHPQEKHAVKAWPIQQQLPIRSNYETTPPRTPTDSFDSMNSEPARTNGGMFTDIGVDTIPNGRPSGSSWESRPVRNTSAVSINGSVTESFENGRKSPAAQNGLSRVTSTDYNSLGPLNGSGMQTQATTTEEATTRESVNGDSEPWKRAPATSSNAYSSQNGSTLTVPTNDQPVTPTRHLTTVHRFSAPEYPKSNGAGSTAPIAGQVLSPAGPSQLKHRNTLQVPKIGPARGSMDDTALSTGRFSPTVATGIRRGSLSLNRRNTQSIHSNMPHEEIVRDEDALRWAEAIRQKRASKRKRKDEEDEDRVVVGTKVDQNHVNYVTAYNMLTGIRFTVSRTNAKLDRMLTDADFEARHKFSFDM